ncbi:MAG: SCO family protein, partial [Alphaproteobacteria bacterium]|nr:SCO family protein [Alphaproteobacteria bacterium]
ALVAVAAVVWQLARPSVQRSAEPAVAEAAIGGPFSLLDHTGRRVSDEDFRGQVLVVFFGYASCPDFCPARLVEIAAAVDALGQRANAVTPLFITIDPERDTPAALSDFVARIHPALVGLTGSAAEIAAVAKAYRVFYARGKEVAGGYLMDHSSVVYVMDRAGKFVDVLTPGADADAIAEKLRHALGQA